MSVIKKYIPLIIEPDNQKLGYLYQAVRAEADFVSVKSFRNIESSIQFLRSTERVDVVLISLDFSQYVISHFIEAAKESRAGREAAYVLLSPTDQDARENVAISMMEGMDGVLFSPFSVHSVKEVARIAEQVRKKFDDQRKKAAMMLLLPNMTTALDDVAKAIYDGVNVTPSKKKLMQSVERISPLRKEMLDEYYTNLFTICEGSRPRSSDGIQYTGASSRLRKKLNKPQEKS